MFIRSNFLVKCWSRQKRMERQDSSLEDLSFSDAVDLAVSRVETDMFYDMSAEMTNAIKGFLHFGKRFRREIEQYFLTGNWDGAKEQSGKSSINPTLLQPTTGNWTVHYTACPIAGYLPLPLGELIGSAQQVDGIFLRYCQNEMKMLLLAFRKRMNEVKFFFHPCDALAFCYGDSSPDGFDVIDSSDLADHVGPINLLNAAARKLRSDQSVLFTESMTWPTLAPSLAQYIQEVLCCPLSLIPTIYGLRLMDDVDLGPESARSVPHMYGASSRFRWKKALPFDGVTLNTSEALREFIFRLKETCSLLPTTLQENVTMCGMTFYSPLTFHYVMDDLVRRGKTEDIYLTLLEPSLTVDGFPPVFLKYVEAIQAWADDRRPVWKVKVSSPFNPAELNSVEEEPLVRRGILPILRLILIPISDYEAATSDGKLAFTKFSNDVMESSQNHFFETFDLHLRMDEVEITFLLEDLSLLDTHCGVVVNLLADSPVFLIGRLTECHLQVESFILPYLFAKSESPEDSEKPGNSSPYLLDGSCQESEGGYSIHFEIHSDDPNFRPSGMNQLT